MNFCRKLLINVRPALPMSKRLYSSQDEVLKEASLYVHWPFCARRCSYCNFNKYIDRKKGN